MNLKYQDAVRFFPMIDADILSKLRISKEALYSLTPPQQAEYTFEIIQRYYPLSEIGRMTILETNGGFGGNTLIFAKYFGRVVFVELDQQHMEIAKHNLKLLSPEYDSIEFIRGDVKSMLDFEAKTQYPDTRIFGKEVPEVVFVDPEWGGLDYKKVRKLDLKISGVNIRVLIQKMFDLGAKLVLVKVPLNYNFDAVSDIGCDMEIFTLNTAARSLYSVIALSKIPVIDHNMPEISNVFEQLNLRAIIRGQ